MNVNQRIGFTKTINGREYGFYKNINLYIIPSFVCNYSCKFCISQTGNDVIRRINSDKIFYSKLNEALRFSQEFNPSISITGGEPTIEKRLPGILMTIKKYNFRNPNITTNLSGLVLFPEQLEAINNSSIKYLNISRHHYDSEVNARFMRAKFKTSNEDLRRIINKTNPRIKIRLQACLSKESMSSYQDIIEYIKFADSLNVKKTMFSEFPEFPMNGTYDLSVINYTKNNFAPINNIISEVEKSSHFKKVFTLKGPYYSRSIYLYDDKIEVIFATANYKVMQELEDTNYVDALIFNPDGSLTGSWNYNSKVFIKGLTVNQ